MFVCVLHASVRGVSGAGRGTDRSWYNGPHVVPRDVEPAVASRHCHLQQEDDDRWFLLHRRDETNGGTVSMQLAIILKAATENSYSIIWICCFLISVKHSGGRFYLRYISQPRLYNSILCNWGFVVLFLPYVLTVRFRGVLSILHVFSSLRCGISFVHQ